MYLKRVLMFAVIAVMDYQVYGNDVKTLYTNGLYYSQYFPLKENLDSHKTLRFSVRTSRDAHIVLSPSHQADDPAYEIILGAHDNTESFIRGRCPCQEKPSSSIRTVNLLDQQEFREFWIRIKEEDDKTFVQVGIGGTDTPFHEWEDSNPLNPEYVSFRSGAVAVWRYGYKNDEYTKGLSADKRQTVVTATGYGQYFPLSEIVSHSDDAVTLYFTVRTIDEFQILLSPTTSSLGDVYEFGITATGAYLRRSHLGPIEAIYHGDDFLHERIRRGFWIKIAKGGVVTLGAGNDSTPLLNWLDKQPLSPQFVSFTLYRLRSGISGTGNFADLQYGLGPDYTLATQDCKPRWKPSAARELPVGAVRGGYDKHAELFVCRANLNGHFVPASFVSEKDGKGQCQTVSGWSVDPKSEFEGLTGCHFSWKAASLGAVPKGGIPAGETDKNTTLYVSRISHARQVIVGKLQPDHLITYAVLSDVAVRPFINYEVLVDESLKR